MKKQKITLGIVLFVFVIFAVSCGQNSSKGEKSEVVQEASLMEVSIGGMTCTGCEQTITASISKLEGVKSVKASFTTGKAVVEYYPEKVDTLKIREAVNGSGYTCKKIDAVQAQ
jgi:copper chaperone CopZ